MTNENAIVPAQQSGITLPNVPGISTIESIKELARMAALSGMAKTKDPYDAFFIAMYGWELGIPPMTALRTIYKAGDGVPTCSGEALLALIRKSGKVRVTVPDPSTVTDSATVTLERLDSGDKQSFTFTKAMADKAGLKGVAWTKYPSNMLIWRAVSMGAKLMCSDITGGMMTVEEISPNTDVDEAGAPIGDFVEGEVISAEEAESKRRIALLGEIHRNINTLIGSDVQISEIKRLAGLDEWSLDDIKKHHPEHSSTEKFAKLVADRWADEQPKAKPSNGNGNHTEDVSEAAQDTDPKSTTGAASSSPANGNTKPVSNGNGGARIGGSKPEFSNAADMKHTPELKEVTLQLNTWKLLESDDKKPYIEFGGIVLLPESERTDAIKTTGEVAKINVRSLDDLQHAGFVASDGTWDDIDGVKGRLDPEMYAVAIRTDVGKNGFSYKPETLSARAEVTEAAASADVDVPF